MLVCRKVEIDPCVDSRDSKLPRWAGHWPDRLGRRSAYQCLQMVVKHSRRHLGAGAWPLLIAVRFSGV